MMISQNELLLSCRIIGWLYLGLDFFVKYRHYVPGTAAGRKGETV